MTYAGLGSIKNYKNLVVPATVIAMAFAVVAVSTVLLGRELVDHYFWHSIYLFPAVLVGAKLVQSRVADKQ